MPYTRWYWLIYIVEKLAKINQFLDNSSLSYEQTLTSVFRDTFCVLNPDVISI